MNAPMNVRDLAASTGMPLDGGEPVFREPWEAQVFAVAVSLQEQGLFTRTEWAEQLGKCIATAQASGDADLGDTYYHHWLAALETLVRTKGLASGPELAAHRSKIHDEYLRKHDHSHDHGDHHDDHHHHDHDHDHGHEDDHH